VNWQAIKTVARDIGCLVLGFGGIAYQQWTGQVNIALLAAYMGMLSIPGGIGLLQLSRGRPETPSTAGPQSSPPSSSSPPPSS
jgi:hypothetical protein